MKNPAFELKTNGGNMTDWRTFRKRRKRGKSDFRPDSEYISHQTQAFLKKNSITLLPSQQTAETDFYDTYTRISDVLNGGNHD